MHFFLLVGLFLLSACSTTKNQYPSTHTFQSNHIGIASQGTESTRIGVDISKLGGNTFDVAVAVGLAVAVERVHSTSIGGGGFAIIHSVDKSETRALDFRELAPEKAYEKMYLDKNGAVIKNASLDGSKAAGVPGLIAGLYELHKTYGQLPWGKIVEPSIQLAANGFVIPKELAEAIQEDQEIIFQHPELKKILAPNDKILEEGDLLVQSDLAVTLKEIQRSGAKGFYSGRVAKKIHESQKQSDGYITQSDLNSYKALWRKPVETSWRGRRIVSMPPPSSGGTHLMQILNTIENDDLTDANEADTVALIANAMQQAYADRSKYLGDPDFVSVPVKDLASKQYGRWIRSKISSKKALRSKYVLPGLDSYKKEPEHTIHFTVMDHEGNTVTMTHSINTHFGSKVVVPGTGILLNNTMDDFSVKPGVPNAFGALGGKNNAIQPKKRPLSSMTPTIVFGADQKPELALGSPNGTRIITCSLLTILNVFSFNMNLEQAMLQLRYHHQWSPDEVRVESPYFNTSLKNELKSRGFNVRESSYACRVQAVQRTVNGLHSVSDYRGDGSAFGI